MTVDPQNLPYRQGVGMCLFNQAGLVFCAERRDTPGAWQMPQGGVKQGEAVAAVAMRELKEEIGTDNATIIGAVADKLRYEFPDFLQYRHGVFRGKYRGQEQRWLALLYRGEDSDFQLVNEHETELPEFIRWRWVELEETPDMIVPFKRLVYERLVADFRSLRDAIRRSETMPAWQDNAS